MFFVRQGATHKIVVGPAVAVANGYVPVTTLTLSGADEAEAILHDNGTVVDISGYTFAAITTADGYYHVTLQSGISNTVGHVTLVINDDSLCLPIRVDYTVVEEAVYDQLFAASAPGAATVAALTAVDGRIPTALVGGRIDATVDATGMEAGAADKIADHTRRRTQANVESSSDGDALSLGSLYGLVQQAQESAVAAGTLTVYRTDGVTSLGTKTLTGDPTADPITEIS